MAMDSKKSTDLQIHSPESMDSSLYEAISSGDYGNFIALITSNPSLLDHTTVQKNTPLHIAAAFNQKRIAEEIIRRRRSILYETNWRADTALHLAARLGSFETAEHLITNGSDEDLELDRRDRDLLRMVNWKKDTALHDAVRNGHRRIAKLLVEKCPELVARVNGAGDSPLFVAAEKNHWEIATEILEVKEVNCEYGGRGGANVFHAIIIRTLKQFTLEVLEKFKDILTKPDDYGWLPLHYAASLGSEELVELILQHQPSMAYKKDNGGVSALHVAAMEGRAAVLKVFSKFCPDSCELLDSYDRTALHVAVEKRQAYAVQKMLESRSFRSVVNQQDKAGNTPLHLAALAADYVIVMMLAGNKRVNKKIMNNEGLTANDIIRWNNKFRWYDKSLSIARLEFNGGLRGMQKALDRESMLEKEEPKPNATKEETSEAIDNKGSIQAETSQIWSGFMDANLVVATIIATVTFSAAFQVPGGYNTEGMAIRRGEKYFRWYLISDALSFGFAAASMFVTFFSGLFGESSGFSYPRRWVTFLTGASLWFMVLAFMMGTSSVMAEQSRFSGLVRSVACFSFMWPVFCLGAVAVNWFTYFP